MRRYLYFTILISGMTVLAMEISAQRLIGSSYGTSNLVWASIIGLILAFLAVGYFIGGRWADRSPAYPTMYRLLAWGAFTTGLVPLPARPLLAAAGLAFDRLDLGILFGAFSVTLALLCVPVTLLGMISPFAVRLAIENTSEAGVISGRIYAISTIGSFVGTFLPVLALIPLTGVTWTFVLFSEVLLLVALGGLWLSAGRGAVLRYAWMPLVVLLGGIWLSSQPIKRTPGQMYEFDSAYNYIEVVEQDSYRVLRLNEGQGQHSMWHPTEIDFYGPWEQFLAAPFFNPDFSPEQVQRMAIVGLAAGTSARQATAAFGPIPIDGFEIDPAIIDVGRKYFDMNLPNLNAIAQDGRWGLAHSQEHYTLIALDAYRPPYIPYHLTTQEFFQVVYNQLESKGAMALNVGRALDDQALLDGLVGTIASIFPSVYVMDIPGSFNSIIYATRSPTQIENLYANLAALYARPEVHPLLIASLERALTNQRQTPSASVVFTDDWAPIEWITNKMVLSFIFSENIDYLQGDSQP